jgi:hypothetical protein
MSQFIVKLAAAVYWAHADSGLARIPWTTKFFEPLRPTTTIHIVASLHWCLKEFESGFQKTTRVDAGLEGNHSLSSNRIGCGLARLII